jgi:hypothetical protein
VYKIIKNNIRIKVEFFFFEYIDFNIIINKKVSKEKIFNNNKEYKKIIIFEQITTYL